MPVFPPKMANHNVELVYDVYTLFEHVSKDRKNTAQGPEIRNNHLLESLTF